MAIYHLEAKIVSRGNGRSAVAASAYLSCSNILNNYDGVRHDFTRKKGLVWQNVFLPEFAPQEWRDRAVLWNVVEEAEKAKDSRLAREFVPALPIELSVEQWQELLRDFINEQFIADGMCADVAIHDPYPLGHNPHAHIMLTVRPLDEHGRWGYKTEKEYLCIKDGEERGFTAAEFKAVQDKGWEKQYLYMVGKKKVYMTPSEAETQGYERVNKYPKSTKYGRQNPISERWNSEEQLVEWRKAWADVANRYLERYGHDAQIDHRSNADRGIEEQPTIHEGVAARTMEKKGIISDRCEINRQIKADNALLRELKATVKKLTDAVKNTLPAIADAMETLRRNMLIFCYRLRHIRIGKREIQKHLGSVKPAYARYISLAKQIKDTRKERKSLAVEKKQLPIYQVFKHKALAAKIAELTEKLEELQSEKKFLLQSLECPEDGAGEIIRNNIELTESNLKRLEAQEQKYSSELNTALQQYAELKEQASGFDEIELYQKRMELRPNKEKEAEQKMENAYGVKYSWRLMTDSRRDVSRHLNEYAEKKAIERKIRQTQKEKRDRNQHHKQKCHDQER